MITTIQKWGNSQGIRIPKTILSSVNWKEGEPLTLHAEDNKIVIEPATKRKNITRIPMNTTKIVIIPRNAPTTMMMSIFGCL